MESYSKKSKHTLRYNKQDTNTVQELSYGLLMWLDLVVLPKPMLCELTFDCQNTHYKAQKPGIR